MALFEHHAGPNLWLRDPQEDWEGALAQVYEALYA